MPRLVPFMSSFGAGEVSPTIYARPDVQKYASACQIIENFHNLPQGGVTRRPGTRMVKEVKDSTALTIVRPFIFSTTQAYILEMGVGYTRFYKNNARVESGGSAVEITTPYVAGDLYDLDFVQSADVLYHLSCNDATRKLERYSDTCWRFRTVNWTPQPTEEFGARPASDLLVSAVTGDNITLEAKNPISGITTFFESDCGREVVVTSGANAGARVGIKAYTSATIVLGAVCEAFVNLTATCQGGWKLTGSPLTGVTPSAKAPVGKRITLTLDTPGWREFPVVTATAYQDCNHYAVVNAGQFEIVERTSSTVAQAIIRGEANATTKAEGGAWTLEEPLWITSKGFAETGDFFEDRLYLNAGYRLVGSKTSDYENFGIGVLDDDAVYFPLNSKSINTIRALVAGRQLQILTAGGEYVATGGADNPITPTNIRVSSETTHGCRGVAPLRVGDVTLFVTRAGKQLREFTIRADSISDVYVAPDLLLLAEHLTEGTTIVDLAYQREPRSTIWALRSDGVLLACSYRREENVVAWSRHTTCGTFESVAVIPHPDGDRDQVWVTAKRTIAGATKRFVEYFDDCTFFYPQLNLDCAFTCNPGSAVTTVGFITHLQGQTVQIVGDGTVYAEQAVGGTCSSVQISPAANKIEVGLGYTSTVQPLRPEVAIQGQTSQTSKMRWVELFVKFLKTVNADVRTDQTSVTRLTFNANCSISDQRITRLGWDCGVVTISQSQPLPSTVLAISGTLELGG